MYLLEPTILFMLYRKHISAKKFLLYDHSNKKNFHPPPSIGVQKNQIKSKQKLLCCTDSTSTNSSENHTEIIVPAMNEKKNRINLEKHLQLYSMY